MRPDSRYKELAKMNKPGKLHLYKPSDDEEDDDFEDEGEEE